MSSALAYEPSELPATGLQTAIATIPTNAKNVGDWLADFKSMKANGWDVVVLLSPDSKTLIGLGSRGGPVRTLGVRW